MTATLDPSTVGQPARTPARVRAWRFMVAAFVLSLTDVATTLGGFALGATEANPAAQLGFTAVHPGLVMAIGTVAYAFLARWAGGQSFRFGMFVLAFKMVTVTLNLVVIAWAVTGHPVN